MPIRFQADADLNQVIVFADWPGRSPKEVEDQVTYPLSVNLQGLAGVKAIRATSEPTRPSPRIPSVLPFKTLPRTGGHFPCLISRSLCGMRRITAIISPIASSVTP